MRRMHTTAFPALPQLQSEGQVLAAVHGGVGLLTLNRPQALNALSLAMVRDLTTVLRHWADAPAVHAVVLCGNGRPGKPPAFCAGGDLRFFHQAALAGDPALGDFFTEEYTLNHLIHRHPKPIVALMDGVVMGGGMGLGQGARLRVLTEHAKVAMPETNIGLFPDVGGGHFLAACPGHVGEWLALTGQALGAADAIAFGLGDVCVPSAGLPALLALLMEGQVASAEDLLARVQRLAVAAQPAPSLPLLDRINRHFAQPDLGGIMASLAAAPDDWSQATHRTLLQRSPLMMAVSLAQVRRGRELGLADDLRMERDLVHHCFEPRSGIGSETVEGIRALVIDKDHMPRWHPATVADVTPEMVEAFFVSPWTPATHPLRGLD